MTPRKTLLIAGAATAILTLGAAAYAAMPAPGGQASDSAAMGGGHGMAQRAHWGGRHGKHGRGFGRFCGKRSGRRLERVTAVIEGLMTFTPPQEQSWKGLTGAMQESKDSMSKLCDELKAAERPATASQGLARMEKVLSAKLAAMQKIRPAFENFYATLDDKQKKAIDNLFSRRGWK